MELLHLVMPVTVHLAIVLGILVICFLIAYGATAVLHDFGVICAVKRLIERRRPAPQSVRVVSGHGD